MTVVFAFRCGGPTDTDSRVETDSETDSQSDLEIVCPGEEVEPGTVRIRSIRGDPEKQCWIWGEWPFPDPPWSVYLTSLDCTNDVTYMVQAPDGSCYYLPRYCDGNTPFQYFYDLSGYRDGCDWLEGPLPPYPLECTCAPGSR